MTGPPTGPAPWAVERSHGPAAAFHGRDLLLDPARAVWVHRVDAPALVLGSAQREDVVDGEAARAAGVAVVRRRSGGGAVFVAPGELLWVDVVVPAGDRWWHADVGRAFLWLGAVWAEALVAAGVVAAGDPVVHRGPLVTGRWGDLVCFAGVGPGEVTVGGRKVVGLSQRRTRSAARFQCAALGCWEPERWRGLLVARPPGAELEAVAVGLGVDRLDALEAAFLAALARR